MKLIKKLYAKLSTFLFSGSKRPYKPTDINKYKNIYLTRDTHAMVRRVIQRLIEKKRNAKH